MVLKETILAKTHVMSVVMQCNNAVVGLGIHFSCFEWFLLLEWNFLNVAPEAPF